MATRVVDTISSVTTTGTKNPTTLTQAPELGFTCQAALSGAGVSATVRVVAWVIGSNPETLGTITLPVPAGQEGAGNRYGSVTVYSVWDDYAFVVDAVSDATGLTLKTIGVAL